MGVNAEIEAEAQELAGYSTKAELQTGPHTTGEVDTNTDGPFGRGDCSRTARRSILANAGAGQCAGDRLRVNLRGERSSAAELTHDPVPLDAC